jgi:hypothetical protein
VRLNVTAFTTCTSPGPCFSQMGSVYLRFSKYPPCSSNTSCLQKVQSTKILSLIYCLPVSIGTEEFDHLRYNACSLLQVNGVSEENAASTLKLEKTFSSETWDDLHRSTRYISEDRTVHSVLNKTSNSIQQWNSKA